MPDPDLMARLSAAIDANFDQQTAWLQTLVAFPSIRGEEAPCQDWLARDFASRGWSVDRYTLSEVAMSHLPGFSPVMDTDYTKAVQIVAALRAPHAIGKSLILQGHVDVVPPGPASMWSTPAFEPAISNGRMNGRGAQDMKSGVSCLVFALQALHDAGYAPGSDVYLQTVTEEECTGNGALSTLARGYRADAVLIPEPTGQTITRGHVGVMWFRIRVQGAPVHVMNSQTGTNAIMSAYRVLTALEALTARINARAKDDLVFQGVDNPVKFNPGVIRGGDWPSSTPAWCEVDCRIGLMPGTALSEARAEVLEAIAEAARQDRFMDDHPPEVTWNGFQADGYVLEPGGEAEAVLGAAHHGVFGDAMEQRASTGVNDTRFYGLYYGIPGLCYGPSGSGLHGFDEWSDLDSVRKTTLVIATFVADWCGLVPLDGSKAA
ncbi:ArgE/DapE family deacylase [Lichenihabitans psoromatis]|uniref:ArgE/DapE family deacylase n=1 Tax=Lichenihabitans psoromatis TaxID=2528642 RepID=UPI0010385425|nr:ArgE/DapE family deacylase [Lichenihabitans psoromatis]